MVVFYVLLIIILFLFMFLCVTSLSVEIEDIRITDVEKLIKIINEYKNKKYEKVFDYISFKAVIKIQIFKHLNVFKIRLNNKKVKKFVIKILLKELKLKINDYNKYKKQMKIQQNIIENIKPKIFKCMKINDFDLILCLGVVEADMTALMVGLLNVVISYIYSCYSCYYDDIYKIELGNINYKINPVYSNDLNFYLLSNIKLSINLYKLFK